MPLYLWYLIRKFERYDDYMMLYAIMHGSYGVAWAMKDWAMPDKTFQQKTSLGSAFVAWAFYLGPYMIPAYLLASGQCDDFLVMDFPFTSFARKYCALSMCFFGMTLTFMADIQKN